MSENPTQVAVLTPPGKSALAVLGIAGPRAWETVGELFSPRRGALPDVPEVGRFWLGRVGEDVADDAVLAVRRLTPQVEVELHVHGGREVVRWLTELLLTRGVEPMASWSALCRPLLSEATVQILANAPTVRTAAIALDQHTGALWQVLDAMRHALEANDIDRYETLRSELFRWSNVAAHLNRPWRVVLAGAPNVGKSSLLNALAGYQRSIVAPTPGTTRDVVTVTLAIDGWPVEFADTAGIRSALETLEGQGIEQAREAMREAELCLWLVDASGEPVFPPEDMDNVRLVVNKIDQPARWDLARAGDAPHVSATTGEGLPGLCEAISRWLVPVVPPAGVAMMPLVPEMNDLQVKRDEDAALMQREEILIYLRTLLD